MQGRCEGGGALKGVVARQRLAHQRVDMSQQEGARNFRPVVGALLAGGKNSRSLASVYIRKPQKSYFFDASCGPR